MCDDNTYTNKELFDCLDDTFNYERVDECFQFTIKPDVFNERVIKWAKTWVKLFNKHNTRWECELTVESSDVFKGFHLTFTPIEEEDYYTTEYVDYIEEESTDPDEH